MELYKILIVDDEEEIRLGVIKKINWEYYGFKVIGDASNGIEAWEKANNLKPDIVMTDIRMPFMDGLELGAKIQEVMPSTKIIIFSGCDDFEYAQKAISINVSEYVLKPINSENLIEILKKLKCKLDEEYDEKRNIEVLQKYYAESIPVMREQFLIAETFVISIPFNSFGIIYEYITDPDKNEIIINKISIINKTESSYLFNFSIKNIAISSAALGLTFSF